METLIEAYNRCQRTQLNLFEILHDLDQTKNERRVQVRVENKRFVYDVVIATEARKRFLSHMTRVLSRGRCLTPDQASLIERFLMSKEKYQLEFKIGDFLKYFNATLAFKDDTWKLTKVERMEGGFPLSFIWEEGWCRNGEFNLKLIRL